MSQQPNWAKGPAEATHYGPKIRVGLNFYAESWFKIGEIVEYAAWENDWYWRSYGPMSDERRATLIERPAPVAVIDFRKAPAGATHYANGYWYRQDEKAYVWTRCGWEFYCTNLFDHDLADELISVPVVPAQPVDTVEPAVWDGEGLPPVGTELEAGFACEEFETWHKGVCVAVGEDPEGREEFCVVKFGDKIAMYTDEGGRMRPIRTPEQIAADERKVAIEQMILIDEKGSLSRTHFCGLLYDAGFRKQVAG